MRIGSAIAGAAALALGLALGACSPETSEVPAGEAQENTDNTQAASADAPDAPPAGELGEEGAIPAAYIGTWDGLDNDCELASELYLEISADTLTFFEAVGEVERVLTSDDYIVLVVAMEGEGETWTDSYRLDLDENGHLHTSDPAEGRSRSEYPRKRCDA